VEKFHRPYGDLDQEIWRRLFARRWQILFWVHRLRRPDPERDPIKPLRDELRFGACGL
jgi:hypothetical protein